MLTVKQLKELLDPLPDDHKVMFETARSENIELSLWARITGVWAEDERVIIVGVPRHKPKPGERRTKVYNEIPMPDPCSTCGCTCYYCAGGKHEQGKSLDVGGHASACVLYRGEEVERVG